MQEEKLKKILSQYTKIPADQIGYETIIDRSAITSSIFLHRMYADLAKEGFVTTGYSEIKDYGMLLHHLGKQDGLSPETTPTIKQSLPSTQKYNAATDVNPIGIDIEEASRMPVAGDYRTDKFYTMYFSASEISFCILQPNPLLSFAGLFAAKEAIVKANGNFKNIPFNAIVIDHLPGGKPIHHDFYLSISHTENLVIAIAIQKNIPAPYSLGKGVEPYVPGKNTSLLFLVSITSIVLAIIALILVILRR